MAFVLFRDYFPRGRRFATGPKMLNFKTFVTSEDVAGAALQ